MITDQRLIRALQAERIRSAEASHRGRPVDGRRRRLRQMIPVAAVRRPRQATPATTHALE
jgi:hypothetical protein